MLFLNRILSLPTVNKKKIIMDDNIDDLLDEVEAKYLSTASCRNIKQDSVKPQKSSSSIINELDDLLAEIDDIKDLHEDPNNKDTCCKSPNFSQNCLNVYLTHLWICIFAFFIRCFPVYLAGSDYPCGLSSSSNKRSCDKLRCTSCDFKVLSFEGFAWHSSTNYLFLRNNVPDVGRLKAKLLFKKGCRAYCCQCFYKTVSSLTPLTQTEVKWVCGQH
ncbi:Protein C8orf37 homolog [Acanthosepion pharaonis]|uniref:Cilia- and flagella-associated protein 418 n=1 Tax=Acanthosepion pharaonis TaxID=158019 RepID=A0A812CMI8_ACAPH|nr:Protein C8orf37 homolog [Sepia pharaonis]